jgi:ATP adenylyltransferase
MDRLWTPWRLNYVTVASHQPAGCVFCADRVQSNEDDLLVYRGESCFIILNLYPYNNGHLMVVPTRHVARLAELSAVELDEVMRFTRAAEMALEERYHPHGFNMGLNLGKSAGAGVADHLHMHIVPRWNGDTNFLTVVGETRVLPETLADTAAHLRPILNRLLNA